MTDSKDTNEKWKAFVAKLEEKYGDSALEKERHSAHSKATQETKKAQAAQQHTSIQNLEALRKELLLTHRVEEAYALDIYIDKLRVALSGKGAAYEADEATKRADALAKLTNKLDQL
jgi:hypothetical protein